MPIYRCKCKSCGFEKELILSRKERDLYKDTTRCPKCNKNEYSFVMGITSFKLKGGGWYKDGYSK